MKVAALDLGTNSFLCLVAEVENGKITKVYRDEMKVVRLGQEVQKTKHFHPQALERAKTCLAEFKKVIDQEQPHRILAMATSAARDVENPESLFDIGKDLAIPIEIIPGGKEAAITFAGALSDRKLDLKMKLVIDVGGGSTEFILGSQSGVQLARSINVGCVRLTEEFFPEQPPKAKELMAAEATIQAKCGELLRALKTHDIDEVIAVAGTPTSLAAAELGGFAESRVHGFVLRLERLNDWIHKFASTTTPERVSKFGIEAGRADVILIGAMILRQSLLDLGKTEMKVSTRGVRYGIALEIENRFGGLV